MKNAINATLVLAAAMTLLPTVLTAAPEKAPAKEKAAEPAASARGKPAAEAPADDGPTRAQLKARKAKKPLYMKAA